MKAMGFEDKLEALEALVKKMETGGLSLAETLECYAAGIALDKELTSALENARARMEELVDGQKKPVDNQ